MKNVTGKANFPVTLGFVRPYFEDGSRVSAGVGRIAFISLALGADASPGIAKSTFTNYSFDVEAFVSGVLII